MAFVDLKVGRKTKAYLFQIFCKFKDRTQRLSKSYNHDREVHVCWYVVDVVESKILRCSLILSLPSNILGMANFLIFAWTFMCPFSFLFFHGPSYALFFSVYSSCLYWREFWERLYGVWNIKGHDWVDGMEIQSFRCGSFSIWGWCVCDSRSWEYETKLTKVTKFDKAQNDTSSK